MALLNKHSYINSRGNRNEFNKNLIDIKNKLIIRLAQIYSLAQITISRSFRRYRLRKNKQKNTYSIDFYFDENVSYTDQVDLVGNFTTNPWKDKVPMEYKFFHRSFMARATAKDTVHCKFYVNGIETVSKAYKITQIVKEKGISIQDIEKQRNEPILNTVNVIELSKSEEKTTKGEINESRRELIGKNSIDEEVVVETRKQKDEIRTHSQTSTILKMLPSSKSSPCLIPKKNPKVVAEKRRAMKKVKSIEVRPKHKRRFLGVNKLNSINISKMSDSDYHPLMNDLVSTVINDPETIFDEEFFDSESPLKQKNKTNYRQQLRRVINSVIKDSPFKSSKNVHHYGANHKYLKFVSGHWLLSKWNVSPCEDACFTHKRAIGIADGVGGWSAFGLSSADFSTELMKRWKKLINKIVKIQKFTSNIIKSSGFQLEIEDFACPVSEQIKARKLHANSFCHNQQGQEDSPLRRPRWDLDVSLDDNDNNIRVKDEKENFSLDPVVIMEDSFKNTKSYGSSTICLCTIVEEKLKVANLGDSGLLLIRYNKINQESKVIFCTKDQQHEFNAPFQLANIPKNIHEKLAKKKGKHCDENDDKDTKVKLEEEVEEQKEFWQDPPQASDVYDVNVKAGDIIVLGTDGVFDNLFLDDILDIIDLYMRSLYRAREKKNKNQLWSFSSDEESENNKFSDKEAQVLAWKIGKAAKNRSRSSKTISPFEQKYNKYLREKGDKDESIWEGGKHDDIGVVVSFIV